MLTRPRKLDAAAAAIADRQAEDGPTHSESKQKYLCHTKGTRGKLWGLTTANRQAERWAHPQPNNCSSAAKENQVW